MGAAAAEPHPLNGGAASEAGFPLPLIDAVVVLVSSILIECSAIIGEGIPVAGDGFAQYQAYCFMQFPQPYALNAAGRGAGVYARLK